MKRAVIIESLLGITLIVLIVVNVNYWQIFGANLNSLNEIKLHMSEFDGDYMQELYNQIKGYVQEQLSYAIVTLIATITTLAAMVLTALYNLPVFKPLLDKLQARKAARTQTKAERAEEAKQDKIKALEAELEELKKD